MSAQEPTRAPEPGVLQRLHALAADAHRLEMDLGVAALSEAPSDPAAFAARLQALDRAALLACQDLYDRLASAARSVIVAVYGQDAASLDQLVGVYRTLATTWRLDVEAAPLHLRDAGASGTPLWLAVPGEKPPERLGDRVGVELLVTGPAATLVFATEAGVQRYTGIGRDALVRVLVHPGTRETWASGTAPARALDPTDPDSRTGAAGRPTEPHRRYFFDEAPRRIHRGQIEDREEKWTIEGVNLLAAQLSERFAERLIATLR